MKTVGKCKYNFCSCFCEEPKGHKGIHKCRCGGSWDKSENPITLPDISGGYNANPLTDEENNFLARKKRFKN